MGLYGDFRTFLIKDNALALAVGVIIGGAMGRFVGSITNDLIMPVIGIFMPADATWQTWGFALGREDNVMQVGSFIAALLQLIIIGFVCFLLVRAFVKPKPAA
jgi:large conductance mechanosensitive channel